MHYPRARTRWNWWRKKRCVCTDVWPCPSFLIAQINKRAKAEREALAAAREPTREYRMVGRAGHLTPAQQRRAEGWR